MVLCAVHSGLMSLTSQPRLLLLLLRPKLPRLLVQSRASKILSQLPRRQLPRQSRIASASHTRITPPLSRQLPRTPRPTLTPTPRASTWSVFSLGPPPPTATWAQHLLSPLSPSTLVSLSTAARASTSTVPSGSRSCPQTLQA